MFPIELPKDKTRIWDLEVPVHQTEDGKHTTVYLTEGIGSPSDYNEACHLMRTAKKGDTFEIVINNGGGYTSTAFMLVDAMKASKATFHAHVAGFAASAATVIALACDTLTIADNSNFMCHNYSHGAEGSGAQVKEYVDYINKEFTRSTKEIYSGFLTDEEMDLISKHDKEVWLNADDVRERWASFKPAKKKRGRPAKKDK